MPTPLPRDASMLYGDAMTDVTRGLKVARKTWPDGTYVFGRAAVLHIHIGANDVGLKQGEFTYTVPHEDVLADDWTVVR